MLLPSWAHLLPQPRLVLLRHVLHLLVQALLRGSEETINKDVSDAQCDGETAQSARRKTHKASDSLSARTISSCVFCAKVNARFIASTSRKAYRHALYSCEGPEVQM